MSIEQVFEQEGLGEIRGIPPEDITLELSAVTEGPFRVAYSDIDYKGTSGGILRGRYSHVTEDGVSYIATAAWANQPDHPSFTFSATGESVSLTLPGEIVPALIISHEQMTSRSHYFGRTIEIDEMSNAHVFVLDEGIDPDQSDAQAIDISSAYKQRLPFYVTDSLLVLSPNIMEALLREHQQTGVTPDVKIAEIIRTRHTTDLRLRELVKLARGSTEETYTIILDPQFSQAHFPQPYVVEEQRRRREEERLARLQREHWVTVIDPTVKQSSRIRDITIRELHYFARFFLLASITKSRDKSLLEMLDRRLKLLNAVEYLLDVFYDEFAGHAFRVPEEAKKYIRRINAKMRRDRDCPIEALIGYNHVTEENRLSMPHFRILLKDVSLQGEIDEVLRLAQGHSLIEDYYVPPSNQRVA